MKLRGVLAVITTLGWKSLFQGFRSGTKLNHQMLKGGKR